MSHTTFLQRAVRPGSFEFSWLCGSAVFVATVAVLVIVTSVLAGNEFRWTTQIDGREVTAEEYEAWQQHARGDQCERLRVGSPVMEPQNTWSNLSYVLVGLLILCRAPLTTGKLLGVYLILVGFTSGLYHASNYGSHNAVDYQKWDIAALNAGLLAMTHFAVDAVCRRFIPEEYARFKARFLPSLIRFGWVFFAPALLGWGMAANRTRFGLFDSTTSFIIFVSVLVALVFAILIVTFSSVENHSKHASVVNDLQRNHYTPGSGRPGGSPTPGFLTFLFHNIWGSLLLTLTIAGLAFFVRLGDGQGGGACRSLLHAYPDIVQQHPEIPVKFPELAGSHLPKLLCSPDSPLQAHAAWHVLSALTLLLAYDLFARVCWKAGRLIAKGFFDG